LILRKLACTINANAVRGRSYENLLYKSFFYIKISRSMVLCWRERERGGGWGGGEILTKHKSLIASSRFV
ncbi:MAG: hypothetical protein MJE68_13105, partial [Proteobacteria bacterium]|nr:hypothetical protein [Pseudomonadota bacterium]